MGPRWTKVLPVSVPRISERHVRPQATNAHLGRPRSTMRANRHICRTPSCAAPRQRTRTAQDHGLAPQGSRERALDVLRTTNECTAHDTNDKYTNGARAPKSERSTKQSADHHTHIREHASEPPRMVCWLQNEGERELPKDPCRVREEHRSTSMSKLDL